MPRACGSHSSWKQHYWGDYTLRKGLLLFWDQFLTNVPFSVFTWRVWIDKTSDFITKMFTSEHLLRRLPCFREMPVTRLVGWWGYPADRDLVLRKRTSIFSMQEGASGIFLSVCCVLMNLNSRVLQSHYLKFRRSVSAFPGPMLSRWPWWLPCSK